MNKLTLYEKNKNISYEIPIPNLELRMADIIIINGILNEDDKSMKTRLDQIMLYLEIVLEENLK